MTNKPTNPTPGYQTTEFWLTLATNILAAVLAYLNTIETTWAVIAATIVNSIYTLARMGTKAAVERAKEAAHKAGNILPLLLACGIAAAFLPSCAGGYATATPGFYKPAPPTDPASKFGVFIERGPKLLHPQK